MWVVLFFFLAVGGLVWFFLRDYRRKTQQWEAASKARFDRIFTEQAARPAATAAPPVRPSAVPVTAPSTPAIPPRITGRFLGQAETLGERPGERVARLVLRSGAESVAGVAG